MKIINLPLYVMNIKTLTDSLVIKLHTKIESLLQVLSDN